MYQLLAGAGLLFGHERKQDEAAYLLKEQKLSVSETAPRLGLTNLSHFSRIFEKHTGQKPTRGSTLHQAAFSAPASGSIDS